MTIIDRSGELRIRLEIARSRALCTCRHSERLRAESARLRSGVVEFGFPRWFVVEGLVEGHPVRARWWRGSLRADQSLRARSELIVELGDEFETLGHRPIQASLEEPMSAMLTLLRACDRATSVAFGPATAPPETTLSEPVG